MSFPIGRETRVSREALAVAHAVGGSPEAVQAANGILMGLAEQLGLAGARQQHVAFQTSRDAAAKIMPTKLVFEAAPDAPTIQTVGVVQQAGPEGRGA